MPKRKLPDEIPPLIGTFKDEGGETRFYRKSETPAEYAARCKRYKANTTAEQRMQRLMVPGWKFVKGKWVLK